MYYCIICNIIIYGKQKLLNILYKLLLIAHHITIYLLLRIFIAIDDIRVRLIIPDLTPLTLSLLHKSQQIVAAVGPIIDTSNGQHVRQVFIVDPQSQQKVKLRCYNEGCMDDFIPHMDVSMSEATFKKNNHCGKQHDSMPVNWARNTSRPGARARCNVASPCYQHF